MPRAHRRVAAVPRLDGKTALVTGASGGVGLEIARGLAATGAALVLPVRSRERGARAVEAIRETAPSADVVLRDLDLARRGSVEALSAQLVEDGGPIHLYVMNAGMIALGDPVRHVTDDGCELHLQTNFLGHFALTLGILPLLTAGEATVVAQLSMAAAAARIDWTDVQLERRYTPFRAYRSSKVALGLFAHELGRRSRSHEWGIAVRASHPGIAPDTGIAPAMRARAPKIGDVVSHRLGNSPAEAAQPALLALTSAVADAASADFFGPSGLFGIRGPARGRRPFRSILDPVEGARVWELGERLAGVGRIG